VLFVVIAAAVVVAVLIGLSMCRLAALSDHDHAVALAEWIRLSRQSEQPAVDDRFSDQLPLDPPDEAFRATG
jgi:hypothetical protein